MTFIQSIKMFVIRPPLFVSVLFLILAPVAQAAPQPQWTDFARQVGQSETVRPRALKALKQIKNLDAQLVAALETRQRTLAVDVICALDKRDLLPKMIEHLAVDEDGFLTLGINSLLTDENKDSILKSYVERLSPDKPQLYSPAATMAMLEPLGRLGVTLPNETLQALSTHAFPEIRESILAYLRWEILTYKKTEHIDMITTLAKDPVFQVRIHAQFLLRELAAESNYKKLVSVESLSATCKCEANAAVLKQCRETSTLYGFSL